MLGGPGLGRDLALLKSHWGLVAVDFFFNLLEYQEYERNTCTHDPGVAAHGLRKLTNAINSGDPPSLARDARGRLLFWV